MAKARILCLAGIAACSLVHPSPVAAQAAPPAAAQAAATSPARPSGAPVAEPAIANYLSSRLNGKPLPVTDRASDSTGTQYLVEFAELILSIRPSHEFRASLRFRQALAIKGDLLRQEPIQKTTIYGSWSAAGKQLRFVPDPSRGGGGLNILAGSFAGPRIEVPFDYRNGSVMRRATVVLIKNDNIF
ncbi:MAG: hypothetical protein ACHQQ3_08770 [Gemmatimonadales bacterium]